MEQVIQDTILVTESHQAHGGWYLAYSVGTLERMKQFVGGEVSAEFGMSLVNVPIDSDSYDRAKDLKPGDIISGVNTIDGFFIYSDFETVGKARVRE